MNIIPNIIVIAGGCVELVSLIICANFLGILSENKINKTRIIPSLIIYIGISVLVLLFINAAGQLTFALAMIMYYLKFFLTICILYKCINRNIIFFTFLADMSISLVGSFISSILANLSDTSSSDVSPFVKTFVQLLVLFGVLFLSKKTTPQRNRTMLEMIPRHIYILLLLAVIISSGLSSLINFQTDFAKVKELLLIIVIMVLTVILMIILASLFLNVIAKQHFTAVSQMMEKQVELQLNHYNELEKLDTEMSRFRHDYTNHLQSILSLIQMNEYSQAEEYIQKLKKEKYKSELHMFYTGSKLADAILSDKAAVLGEGGRIDYSGIIPPSIEYVDLCTVLSNSLDNAIEACRELPSPGVISIHAAEQQGYFVLSVRNPTVCTENYYTIPVTTKDDKEHHGMGLYNIESTVKKHDGQMKIKCENGFFELMITMKL